MHFSVGPSTVVRSLDNRIVSSAAEFRSFLLGMCIDAPESTTNPLSSGFVEDGPKASRMWLYPFVSASGHVSPFPMRLFGRIALVARFLPEICPQISEHT